MKGNDRHPAGFTLLELVISLALVLVLLSVLLPALSNARMTEARHECASHLRSFGGVWHAYLNDHDGRFPYVPVQPSWHYAGVRFSPVDEAPFLDTQRPLTLYIQPAAGGPPAVDLLRCPADHGITGAASGTGTGARTAYRSFGTSYRANSALVDARLAGVTDAHRALRRDEILTVPSRLIVMGDPIWYEVYERTGRDANWHGEADSGNLLFLDGTVKFMSVLPKPRVGPAVCEPMLREDVGGRECTAGARRTDDRRGPPRRPLRSPN